MPSFKKKFAGFWRQLSNSSHNETETHKVEGCFIQQYLHGKLNRHKPPIYNGKTCTDLPVMFVGELDNHVIAAYTGPEGGLSVVNKGCSDLHIDDSDVDYIDIEEMDKAEQPSVSTNPMKHATNQRNFKSDPNLLDTEDKNIQENTVNKLPVVSLTCNPNENYIEKPTFMSTEQLLDDKENLPTVKNRSESFGGIENKRKLPCDINVNFHIHFNATETSLWRTGPPKDSYLEETIDEEIAGICNWSRHHPDAFGCSTTLYECHPTTQEYAGQPIADAFAIVARGNNAIIALADGVNWGKKASLAARCAIHGCIDYLNKVLFGKLSKIQTTSDIFVALLRSFHAAHSLILKEDGMLTTLTTAVVVPLMQSDQHVVCVCNVGDSLAYVYSKQYGVREITQGSHDIYSMRDMRDALGALGPVDGVNPELSNLTCSMTVVSEGDFVFITSDGISDNFDPVVGKFCIPKKEIKKPKMHIGGHEVRHISEAGGPVSGHSHDLTHGLSLPAVEAYQRHELTLLRMEDILGTGVGPGDPPTSSAQHLCQQLTDFAWRLTNAKRRILEDPELYDEANDELDKSGQRSRRRKVCDRLAMVPGKLDHASVAAYRVGLTFPNTVVQKSFSDSSEASLFNEYAPSGGLDERTIVSDNWSHTECSDEGAGVVETMV